MKLSCLLLVETTKSSRSGAWLAPSRPERRVGEDDVEALGAGHFVDRVAEADVRLDLVEVEVHEREAPRPGDEFLPVVGVGADALGDVAVERSAGLVHEPLVGGDEESAGAAGGVADLEVAAALGGRA